jgi:soluble lytic murein transglycosylase-like protein
MLAGVVTPAVRADSITVDGTRYQDVYIREGVSTYYVQVPKDGTVIAVPKAQVPAKDINITRGEAARAVLLETWRSNRSEAMADEDRVALVTGAEPLAADIQVATHVEPKVLTNISEAQRAQRRNRPVFMGPGGVAVLTNKAGKYRGNDEYVELTLHYAPIVVPARFRSSASATAPAEIGEIVGHYSRQYHLPPNLVLALIKAESNFNVAAVSPAGARGLMQLMPGTAAEMGVSNIFDPAENIAGGTQYLSKMLQLFNGDTTLALAAYNAGPGAVMKHNGVPPYNETRTYIQRVNGYYADFEGGSRPVLRVAEAPETSAAPEVDVRYTVFFRNGYTQPAETVEQVDDYYLVQFKGRITRVRKGDVLQVKEKA